MGVLDPSGVPVFALYVLIASLFVLVPLATRQPLHVGHGMAVLTLFVGFSRIFFFDYNFEVLGEGSFYIGHMVRGEIPGLAALYQVGMNPPAVFSLFYFGNNVVGLDPVVNLKAFRLIFGFADIMLVYLIGRRLFAERRVALAAAILFAWSEVQLTFFEGDQFKNLLGHTFFLAFVLLTMDWLDAFGGGGRPGQLRRLLGMVALAVGMLLSHQVYANVLAGVIGLTAVGLALRPWVQRFLGSSGGVLFMLGLGVVVLYGYGYWVREFLPNWDLSGLVAMTEFDYGSLTLMDELLRPGIFFSNVQLALATVGAILCARREGTVRSRILLLTMFGFFSVLAKQYVVGLYFQPVRFLMIDGPFICLFLVYALWDYCGRLAGMGERLFWAGIGLLVLGNLALMQFGAANLNIWQRAFRVRVGDVQQYLFGSQATQRQLWLLLLMSAVLVAAVCSVTWEPSRRARGARGPAWRAVLFFGAAAVGLTLGVVWLVEPLPPRSVILQFIGILFPAWVLGWMPWRAIEPGGDPETEVTRLAMVPVISLLVFVVLWYLVLTVGGWSIDEGARWSTLLTFVAPMALLITLAGAARLGTRWRA